VITFSLASVTESVLREEFSSIVSHWISSCPLCYGWSDWAVPVKKWFY